jgi:fructosamine-3-kinase
MKKEIKVSDIGLVTESMMKLALPNKDYYMVYRWVREPRLVVKLGTLARMNGQKRQWYWHLLKVLLFAGFTTKEQIVRKGFTNEATVNKWIKLYIEEVVNYQILLRRNKNPKRSMLHEHVQELLLSLLKTKRKMV